MAEKFGVSRRTAYRHLAAGTEPDSRRRRGADGKTYPGSAASYAGRRSGAEKTTPNNPDLVMARNAIRRLLRLSEMITSDLPFLDELERDAAELAASYRSEPA